MPGHRQISLQGGGDKTSKRRLSPDAFITAPLPSFITRGDGVEEVGGQQKALEESLECPECWLTQQPV